MRLFVILLFAVTLGACAGVSQWPQVPGGQRVTQAGYSFVTPGGKSWVVLVRSTYQVTLGAIGDKPNETLVTSGSTFQVPSFSSPQDFLAHVKASRAAVPQTGRFETVRNEERLFPERTEVCVIHEAESKDFGAKRGSDYTAVQYFGMNCIHPQKSTVGVFVELSRKAPPGTEDTQFKAMGAQLLRSVEFGAYK